MCPACLLNGKVLTAVTTAAAGLKITLYSTAAAADNQQLAIIPADASAIQHKHDAHSATPPPPHCVSGDPNSIFFRALAGPLVYQVGVAAALVLARGIARCYFIDCGAPACLLWR